MARIRFVNVTKRYGDVIAVADLNLEIYDREFVVLLGPSGCGKSTTLNMIAGLEEITSGQLWFDDLMVNDRPPHRRDVAMVFQSYALYPHKTVYENIALGLRMRRVSSAELDRRVRDAATKLAITPCCNGAKSTIRRPAATGSARPGHGASAVSLSDGRAVVQPRCCVADFHAR